MNRTFLAEDDDQPSLLTLVNENGIIAPENYFRYRQQMDNDNDADYVPQGNEPTEVAPKRHRSCKKKDRDIVDDDGKIYTRNIKESNWYIFYVMNPDIGNADFEKEFRNRFRLPFRVFQELCQLVKEDVMFAPWCRSDCTGSPSTPIELHVLGALRHEAGLRLESGVCLCKA
jgi:hypothetical protein